MVPSWSLEDISRDSSFCCTTERRKQTPPICGHPLVQQSHCSQPCIVHIGSYAATCIGSSISFTFLYCRISCGIRLAIPFSFIYGVLSLKSSVYATPNLHKIPTGARPTTTLLCDWRGKMRSPYRHHPKQGRACNKPKTTPPNFQQPHMGTRADK